MTVGTTSGPKFDVDLRYVFYKQLHVIGSTMGSPEDFRQVMAQVWAGRLRAVIDRVLPLDQGREGHVVLEEGTQFGKILLKP